MCADDGNALVEAYDFFVNNTNSKRITRESYLNKRGQVLSKLCRAVLESPGYLGIFLGILLGWISSAGYLADFFVSILLQTEADRPSDSYAHVLRVLAGLVVVLAIWFISRHSIEAYRACGKRSEGTDRDDEGSEVQSLSRIWVGVSIILFSVSSVIAGYSLYALSRSFFGVPTLNKALSTFIIVAGMWSQSLRVCWIGIGVNGVKRPTALLIASLIPGIGIGAVCSQCAGVDTSLSALLEALAVTCSSLFLIWHGFVGIILLEDAREIKTVSRSVESRAPQKRVAAEWVRKDAPRWLVSFILCTAAIVLLDVIGVMLLAMFGAAC